MTAPLLVERLRAGLAPGADLECLDDYQLQIEHALDLVGRQRVLFVDASLHCRAPFEATRLHAAAHDTGITTHALSPQALLHVYRELHLGEAPPCTLLAIRGEGFELGAAPTGAALAHLDAALDWARDWASGVEMPLDSVAGE